MNTLVQIFPVDLSAIGKEHITFALISYSVLFLSLFLLFLVFSMIPKFLTRNLRKELHDEETAILTIKKVGKSYSPWNSKIYNVINFNRIQR